MAPLSLGTRGSQLAMYQARTVARLLEERAGAACEIRVIRTSGDRLQEAPLSEVGGKRLFVKEIEDALLNGEVDLAVHSSKDMPAVLPDGLMVGAVLPREDARDAVVLPLGRLKSAPTTDRGSDVGADFSRPRGSDVGADFSRPRGSDVGADFSRLRGSDVGADFSRPRGSDVGADFSRPRGSGVGADFSRLRGSDVGADFSRPRGSDVGADFSRLSGSDVGADFSRPGGSGVGADFSGPGGSGVGADFSGPRGSDVGADFSRPGGSGVGADFSRPRGSGVGADFSRPMSVEALLRELGREPRIGTSSVRRTAQLLRLFPGARFLPIRGNLDTRLRKLDAGEYDALVLAAAGLNRLEQQARISALLPPEACVPAPGQGIIAIEVRAADARVRDIVREIDDRTAAAALAAERAVVVRLGGGCQMPIGAYASIDDGRLALTAVVVSVDGIRAARADASGAASDAERVGNDAAELLLARGAADILREVERARATAEGLQP
ncbi:MAG: hydroxymethylbilane synthase [Acidimicrobiia bacterium]|nr:hydroxymethylbilane synthase [Acidimicrobiia bacterium]